MSMHTAILATLITMFGVAQYGLCIQATRDLMRRPRVRGDNKAIWAFLIICVPIVGAIIYNWMGPTSFVGRRTVSHLSSPHAPHQPTPVAITIASENERRHQARREPPPSIPREIPHSHRVRRIGS